MTCAATVDRVAEMRAFIDMRFRDIPSLGWDANKLHACAHNALDMLIAGDIISADIVIGQLDPMGAVDFRKKVAELGFLSMYRA